MTWSEKVLRFLAALGEPATSRDVAKALGMTHTHASNTLSSLLRARAVHIHSYEEHGYRAARVYALGDGPDAVRVKTHLLQLAKILGERK